MHILDKIVVAKRREVDLKKSLIPVKQLEKSQLMQRDTISLVNRLSQSNSGIISEHKRRSPSKATINTSLSVEEVIKGYTAAGVSGISVLTDGQFFGGSLDDLLLARASSTCPLLRKEFIIDEYQLIEARAHGADVILLIASILSSEQIRALAMLATDLGLEVLLEVHHMEELERCLFPEIDMIGVNNRNLKTFEVSVENSLALADRIPDRFLKISESGIDSIETIKELRAYGYRGFLIGEQFMRSDDPGKSAKAYIQKLER
ncbi:MAG: indole-3-glycerol phosphate synthase TrpC [Flavobacteriaceae bacterium]